MIVETRKTAQGTEYWDAKEKRVRFVPAGEEPDFDVTKNPKSMIAGVDLATGKDSTVINGSVINNSSEINLDEMDADQLRDFAKQHNIDLPFNVKKEETIRKNIEEALAAASTDGE